MFDHIVETGGLDIPPNMQLRVKDLILGGDPDYEAKARLHRKPVTDLKRSYEIIKDPTAFSFALIGAQLSATSSSRFDKPPRLEAFKQPLV